MPPRRASTVRRRDLPLAAGIVVGLMLPVVAAVLADAVWDDRYLLVPATWLIGATVVAALAGGSLGGTVAVITAVLLNLWFFVPPYRSFAIHTTADFVASITFTILAVGLTATIELVIGARRRADRSLASLDALVVNAPVGVAFFDRDLRFVQVNAALNHIAGRDITEHAGSHVDIMGRPELSAIAQRVIDTGETIPPLNVDGLTSAGLPFHVTVGFYAVWGTDGDIEGVGVLVNDVTQSVEASLERDRILERVMQLQQITGALAEAASTGAVTAVVLDDVRRVTGAAAVSLSTVTDGQLGVVASDGYDAEVLEPWLTAPLDAPIPLAEAARTGELVVSVGRDEILERWPMIEPQLAPERQSLVALPLLVDGVSTGAIGLSFDVEWRYDDDTIAFLKAIATQCAGAFLRARLHESEALAHAGAAAAAARLAFLAEASDALASSLDTEATLRQVADLAVPRLADFAAVYMIEGDGLAALAMVDVEREQAEEIRRIFGRWPPQFGSEGMAHVIRTGRSLLVEELRPEDVSQVRNSGHATALIDAGFRSLLAVPMRAGDRVVGIIALAAAPPRRLDGADLALASELATRAGQAVLNAELFRDRSVVAATLQASLLGPAEPAVPGLEVATRFFAVGEGIEVGGDFYDVFPMGTVAHPAGRWAVVIGDVRGKGSEAAAISGAARHAVRAAALHELSPAAILRTLNELLLVTAAADDPEPRFCTAVVAVVEPTESGAQVVLSVGGHPPPFVLRSDGRTEAVECQGTIVGVFDEPELAETTVELGTGDSLVLYTDGITERHLGDQFFDEEGLASVLSRCAGFTAASLAERIETAARGFVEDAPRDDLAIVVVRVPDRRATTGPASAELPADASAPGLGRRFVTAALETVGLDHHVEVAQLLTSELVTNAIVHGEGPYRISLEHGESTLGSGSPTPGRARRRSSIPTRIEPAAGGSTSSMSCPNGGAWTGGTEARPSGSS